MKIFDFILEPVNRRIDEVSKELARMKSRVSDIDRDVLDLKNTMRTTGNYKPSPARR